MDREGTATGHALLQPAFGRPALCVKREGALVPRTLFLKPLNHGDPPPFLPSIARALFDAAAQGEDIVPVIQSFTRGLGFDTFLYRARRCRPSDRQTQDYVVHISPEEVNPTAGDLRANFDFD